MKDGINTILLFTLLFFSLTEIVVARKRGFDLTFSDKKFDFGVEEGDVIYVTNGEINQKHTRVPINVPPCQILSHVTIVISGSMFTPQVTFEEDTQEIFITYSFLQPPESAYSLRAKAIPDPLCKSNPRKFIRQYLGIY